MKLKKILNEIIKEKTSSQIFNPKRNKKVVFNVNNYTDSEFRKEMYDLIRIAYSEIGGHIKIQNPNDIADPEWNYWEGTDIHKSSDFDIVIFGKRTNYGIKFAGVGHDGDSDSKRKFLDQAGTNLKKIGFYLEASGKLAQILINKYKVPVVTDRDVVEKVLGKQVVWVGTSGWYTRTIGGQSHTKILLGTPRGISTKSPKR